LSGRLRSCSQSARHDGTGDDATRLMAPAEVLQAARQAKADGATRFA